MNHRLRKMIPFPTDFHPSISRDIEITSWLEEYWNLARSYDNWEKTAKTLREQFATVLSADSMQGFALCKPRGYAGDFEIIDRIYQYRISEDPSLAPWDHFYHRQASPRAVRNRKTYFHHLLDSHMEKRGAFSVLKIASGPGRSMFEWLTDHPHAAVTIDCVEMDADAISFAARLNAPFLDRITFTQVNALRHRPTKTYDLIWAAGIFDYFTDRTFVSYLRRLGTSLSPGGEIVIGNFSENNPSRPYMELIGDWFLHHRSSETLRRLALLADYEEQAISVHSEPLGVNLFLHIHGCRTKKLDGPIGPLFF